MHCERKLKLRLHNTSYCLIEVVTKYRFDCICKYCSVIVQNVSLFIWAFNKIRREKILVEYDFNSVKLSR